MSEPEELPADGLVEAELPEAPSTREGVTWDGQEFVPTQMAWHSGTWVPSHEPEVAVVNNETALEKLPGVDRLLVMLAVLAPILLLCAGAFALLDAFWSSRGDTSETSTFATLARVSLIAAIGLFTAWVALAFLRLGYKINQRRARQG